MGPGQKFLLLGLDQPSLVWVWKIFPKNPKFFNFVLFGSKKYHRVGAKSFWVKASYLLWVKSMLGLAQVQAHLYE